MSKHVTLDQLRARHAWEAVKRILEVNGSVPQDYKREVKRLPVRIHTAGLGQALGFLYAKSDSTSDAKSLLLKDLAKWLLVEREFAKRPNGVSDRSAILHVIVDGDAELLRRITAEALMYLQWLGRFTEAEIKQG